MDWSVRTNLIVCGGENCRYMIYNIEGHLLYTSELHSDPILSLSWSPTGEFFAVGTFGKILLSNLMGYIHTSHNTGIHSSIINTFWSTEQSHLITTCSDGSSMKLELVGKRVEWNNFSAELIDDTSLRISNHEPRNKMGSRIDTESVLTE